MKDPIIRNSYEVSESLMADAEAHRMYELREKARLDWNSSLNFVRREEQLRLAKRMLEEGVGEDLICEITGLSKEQLLLLKGK